MSLNTVGRAQESRSGSTMQLRGVSSVWESAGSHNRASKKAAADERARHLDAAAGLHAQLSDVATSSRKRRLAVVARRSRATHTARSLVAANGGGCRRRTVSGRSGSEYLPMFVRPVLVSTRSWTDCDSIAELVSEGTATDPLVPRAGRSPSSVWGGSSPRASKLATARSRRARFRR